MGIVQDTSQTWLAINGKTDKLIYFYCKGKGEEVKTGFDTELRWDAKIDQSQILCK